MFLGHGEPEYLTLLNYLSLWIVNPNLFFHTNMKSNTNYQIAMLWQEIIGTGIYAHM